MNSTTAAGRGLSILAGVAFTAGALYILLEDAVKNQHWTMAHALTVLTVFGTIASGHLGSKALRHLHLFAAAGFTLLFLAGTVLTVMNSVGRQAEASDTSLLSVEDRNSKRIEAKDALASAEKMLDEERASLARECQSGEGKRCKGIAASVAVYEAAVQGHKGELKDLGSPEPVAPEAEKMAEILALFGANKTTAKAVLMLIKPFLYTLFFEIGSIVSWGYAFKAVKTVAKPLAATVSARKTVTETVRKALPRPDTQNQAVYDALAMGPAESNDELARRMGVSKSEASRRVAALNGRVVKLRRGREVQISLAH